jgi:hypothetical protein
LPLKLGYLGVEYREILCPLRIVWLAGDQHRYDFSCRPQFPRRLSGIAKL